MNIRAPTNNASSSYRNLTSIGSVGGAPSTGSTWRKSFAGDALARLRRPTGRQRGPMPSAPARQSPVFARGLDRLSRTWARERHTQAKSAQETQVLGDVGLHESGLANGRVHWWSGNGARPSNRQGTADGGRATMRDPLYRNHDEEGMKADGLFPFLLCVMPALRCKVPCEPG